MDSLIRQYARRQGIPRDEANGFFTVLRTNALRAALDAGNAEELLLPDQIKYIAVRLWTSQATLGGREFCSILNQALRDDNEPAIDHAVSITHALNAFCVTRRVGGNPVQWPPNHVTFRGTALPREHRAFFTVGQAYRAPMFLATSVDASVSIHSFLGRLDPSTAHQRPPYQEPTLWRFHLDGNLAENHRCVHVNYVDRTDNSFQGNEFEFLYSPYSVFTVRAVEWHPAPVVDNYASHYHIIDVDVAPDNGNEPDDLPLAPWC